MSHEFSSLSDAEIDEIRSKRGTRESRAFALLGTVFVVSASIAAIATGLLSLGSFGVALSSFVILAFWFIIEAGSVDELQPLVQNDDAMDEALALIARSAEAKAERDRILASGRGLRVFDLWDLERVHRAALHQQKVQQLNSQ